MDVQKSLAVFGVETKKVEEPKKTYVTVRSTFDKYCKNCRELIRSEPVGHMVRVYCKVDKCVK